MKNEEYHKKLEELRRQFGYRPPDLIISRVPKNTLDRFLALCTDEDFCKDRGMLLKYLLDFHAGIIPTGIQHLEAEIMAIKSDIEALKQPRIEQTKPARRTLAGTGVGKNGNTK